MINFLRRLKRRIVPAKPVDQTPSRDEVRRRLYEKYRDATMIPPDVFVANLELAERARSIPGAVVECGVWRGGMSAAMAEILGPDRDYYLYDSFAGLPPAKEIDGPAALVWQRDTASSGYHDNCTASEAEAAVTMKRSPATRVRLIRGWFDQTMPASPPAAPVALLRLDSDWYESTMPCLEHIYPRVAAGGLILIDDYFTWDGCARAVHDYLSRRQLADRLHEIAPGVAYIVKT